MWTGRVIEAEAGLQVALEVLFLLNVIDQGLVDLLLHILGLFFPLLILSFAVLHVLQSLLGGILKFVLGISAGSLEELIGDVVSVYTSQGNNLLGGDAVGRVHSAEGNTIDCERSCHKQVA